MVSRQNTSPRAKLSLQYREMLEQAGATDIAAGLRRLQELVRYGKPGQAGFSILGEELRVIAERANRSREAAGRSQPDLLLAIVGYSPEPLLMALAFHAPMKIALLVGEGLSDEYLRSLRKLWGTYCGDLGAAEFDDPSVLKKRVGDSPAEVFEAVREIAEDQAGRRMILDVTCAKKSMIAGAFVAAGFLDIETSYVDFDSYDPVLRRPDPGSCRPMRLRHPDALFRLKEQGRLEEAFDQRRFSEAHRLAEELVDMTLSPETQLVLGEREARRTAERFERIRDLSAGYSLWRDGFYCDAHEQLRVLKGVRVPETVAVLARVWPRQADEQEDILGALTEERVFGDPITALAYFLDVLVWNGEVAVQSQPRAAFLRLYGAAESVIFFAFEVFVGRDSSVLKVTFEDDAALAALAVAFPRDRQGVAIDWHEVIRRAAITFFRISSVGALRVLARTSAQLVPQVDLGPLLGEQMEEARQMIPRVRAYTERPPLARGLYNRLSNSRKGGFGRFSSLRNKVVHWMAPVPVESVLELRRFYLRVVGELVPRAVDRLGEHGSHSAREGLEGWRDRLLAAAQGQAYSNCEPLTYLKALSYDEANPVSRRRQS